MSWTAGVVLQDDERWILCFCSEAFTNNDVVGITWENGVAQARRPTANADLYGVVENNSGLSLSGIAAQASGYVQVDGPITSVKTFDTVTSGDYLNVVLNETYAKAAPSTAPNRLTFALSTSSAVGSGTATVSATLNSQIYRQHDGLIGG